MNPEKTLNFCVFHREHRVRDGIYLTTLSIATFIQREQYINTNMVQGQTEILRDKPIVVPLAPS